MTASRLCVQERATITDCHFTRIGGNGIMISAYNQHATVSHSDFAWMGGSAIAAWVSAKQAVQRRPSAKQAVQRPCTPRVGGLAATDVTTII